MSAVYERDGVWYAVPKPVPLARLIRGALLNAMAYCDGNQGHAAKLLGVTDRVMNYQLSLYCIPRALDGEQAPRPKGGRPKRHIPPVCKPPY